MITVEGTFITGIQGHKAFTLREGTVRDSVEALEECGPEVTPPRLRYATLARRLSVTGVEQVTTDMVMDLTERDGWRLEQAADALEKKLDGSNSD